MVEADVTRPERQEPAGHLTDNELAALLDHDLAPDERRRLEAHLESCERCRAELVEMRRIVTSYAGHSGRAGRRVTRWWIPLVVAAGLGALIVAPRFGRSPHAPAAVRTAPLNGEGTRRLAVVAPADNATVKAADLTFTWRSSAADLYRISLLTESGEPVWTAEKADTSIRLPAGVTLRVGDAYFWRVEAVTSGITATTGVHRLLIGR